LRIRRQLPVLIRFCQFENFVLINPGRKKDSRITVPREAEEETPCHNVGRDNVAGPI
jgi:hypothetical protein